MNNQTPKSDCQEDRKIAKQNALIVARLYEWLDLSDSGLRTRCGEMTAQEIRTVRAVLSVIIESND